MYNLSSLFDRIVSYHLSTFLFPALSPNQSTTSADPDPSISTKILYFTPRSVTPFMSLIHGKRIVEIQLRDFKALFDRPGFFRFHFKAVDQEFGMVKEEVRLRIIM